MQVEALQEMWTKRYIILNQDEIKKSLQIKEKEALDIEDFDEAENIEKRISSLEQEIKTAKTRIEELENDHIQII